MKSISETWKVFLYQRQNKTQFPYEGPCERLRGFRKHHSMALNEKCKSVSMDRLKSAYGIWTCASESDQPVVKRLSFKCFFFLMYQFAGNEVCTCTL